MENGEDTLVLVKVNLAFQDLKPAVAKMLFHLLGVQSEAALSSSQVLAQQGAHLAGVSGVQVLHTNLQ